MPKVLVTRWRWKRPVYMIPIKRPELIVETNISNELGDIIKSVTQMTDDVLQDIVPQKSKSFFLVLKLFLWCKYAILKCASDFLVCKSSNI